VVIRRNCTTRKNHPVIYSFPILGAYNVTENIVHVQASLLKDNSSKGFIGIVMHATVVVDIETTTLVLFMVGCFFPIIRLIVCQSEFLAGYIQIQFVYGEQTCQYYYQ
jgi:hypothetical protein